MNGAYSLRETTDEKKIRFYFKIFQSKENKLTCGKFHTTAHAGACGERKYRSYSFLSSALDGGEWSASRLGRALAPGERTPDTHWPGGCVGPRAGLDTEATGKILSPLPGIEPRSPGRPARSQTLY
jgi:hypothetical protein